MKKLLSIILCAIMLIATASPAFANEPINDNVNVGLEAYANEVIAEYIPISMGTVDETDTFFLTQGYRVINNPDPNSRTFFLFRNGKCEGKLTASYVNGEYASSFTQYEIPAVTEAYENNEPFALVAENTSVILFTASDAAVISGVNSNYTIDRNDVTADYQCITLSHGFSIDAQNEIQASDEVLLSVTRVANSTSPLGYGLCWAACSSSLGYYHSGGTLYTALQIYNYLVDHYGDDGYYGRPRGIPEWELRALLIYEYNGSDGSGGLTYSQVRNKLQNGYPVLADIYSSSNVGHSVIICGCINATDGSVKYRLRDPNNSSYVYISNVSLTSTNFTYVAGNTTYTTWSSYVW